MFGGGITVNDLYGGSAAPVGAAGSNTAPAADSQTPSASTPAGSTTKAAALPAHFWLSMVAVFVLIRVLYEFAEE